MFRRYFIDADVHFISTADGGRTQPLYLDHPTARYRPHVVVGDVSQRVAIFKGNHSIETYLGVEFQPQNTTLWPGDSARVRLGLMFYPAPEYDALQRGVTFTVREGAKVVGYGTVTSSIIES
jgi:translation elongation factor EF-Tu-like GTPase